MIGFMVDDTYPNHKQIWKSQEKDFTCHDPNCVLSHVRGRETHIGDVVGNLTLWARCEQYIENEEWAPAEDERKKYEAQNLEA